MAPKLVVCGLPVIGDPDASVIFFITVDGQTPRAFDPNFPPAITTQEGAVEDWTIENRALETHAFHMHQIHFKVLEVDGKKVPQLNPDFDDFFFQTAKIKFSTRKLMYNFSLFAKNLQKSLKQQF